jgi:hypothetical protein
VPAAAFVFLSCVPSQEPHGAASMAVKESLLGIMQAGVTEEDYYYAEYTAKEREEGLHLAAMKFVSPQNRRQLTLGSTACSRHLQLSLPAA